jgi:hypothetical protein
MVFCGDHHFYQRTVRLKAGARDDKAGVTYVITGGAGAGLKTPYENELVAVQAREHHYGVMTITGDRLVYEVFLTNGKVLDRYELILNGRRR